MALEGGRVDRGLSGARRVNGFEGGYMQAKVNVGLARNDGGSESMHNVYWVLETCGFEIEGAHVARSGTEDTYVAEIAFYGERKTLEARLWAAAFDLHQDCIALRYESGEGKLIGPNAAAWGAFDSSLFLE